MPTTTPESADSLPKVSIILPTYNRARWLPRAIDSCLQQSLRDLELIVVDDGSRDDTRGVVSEYQRCDSRVRYCYQDNAKLPAALNTGHRHSRGRYLTWTSDDNCYEPEALEVMSDRLDQSPDAGLVYCNQKVVDQEGRVLRVRDLPGPDRLWEGSCVGACFMYRRSVYEAVGDYNTDLFLAEDYDYWLRISRQFPVVHLRHVAPYRAASHPQSLTERYRGEIEWQCARARAYNTSRQVFARYYLAEGHFALSYSLRRRAEWRLARQHGIRAICCWPFSAVHYRNLLGCLLRRCVEPAPAVA